MKITREGTLRPKVPAWQVTISDPGGYFGGGPLTLEEIIALIGVGTLPDTFLRVFGGGKGRVFDLGTLGATPIVDVANANAFYGVIDQSCDVATVGWTDERDCQIRLELEDDGTGGFTVALDGATWIGAAPGPTVAGGVVHIVAFSRDAGVTIWGVVLSSSVVAALDDLTDVVISSPVALDRLQYDGSAWVNTAAIWRPLMDGAGNVMTDGGTGEAIMALS